MRKIGYNVLMKKTKKISINRGNIRSQLRKTAAIEKKIAMIQIAAILDRGYKKNCRDLKNNPSFAAAAPIAVPNRNSHANIRSHQIPATLIECKKSQNKAQKING